MSLLHSSKFLFRAILIILGIKFLLMFLFPLTSDEGYYWLWSKHLALSYVDHPPMIAWINWLLQKVFWEPLIALRMGAFIFSALIAWVLWELSQQLFGTKKSQEALHLRNVFLFLLIPNTLLIWLVLTVELPFVLFYLLAVLFFVKFLKSKDNRNLYLTGLWVGLGLLTKYTMILIYPAILIWVLAQKKYHFLLRKIEFWLAGALGLLIFSPVLIANLLQKGESFLFHLQRIGGTPWFADTPTFVAEQLVYLTPFLAYLILRFYEDKAAKHFSHSKPAVMFVSLAALVSWLFFFLLSFKTHVWPHWPVVAYGLFVLLVGYWFSQKNQFKRLRRVMIGMGIFDAVLLVVLLFVSPNIVGNQSLYWSNYQLAGKIQTFLKDHPNTIFISDYHGSVAQLRYYGRVPATMPTGILAVEDGLWGKKQFERWNGAADLKLGQDLVVLTNPNSTLYQKAQKYFSIIEPLPDWQMHVMEGHLQGKRFFWFKNGSHPQFSIGLRVSFL
jgi:4-amino-4-deoxy-L-arabinose transferase-like glycosyltransferase